MAKQIHLVLPIAVFLSSMLTKINYYLVPICLFKSILLSAQDINLGLRVNEISKQERETFNTRINMESTTNLKSQYHFAELIAEKVNHTNTFQRINIGINIGQINQNNIAVYNSIGKSVTLYNTQTSLGYSFMYGLGKKYSFKKLIFRFGVEMSGRYFTPWVIETNIEYYDTNNVNYQTVKYNTTYAPYYIFGATMLSAIHYNFYKTFSAGIEFGNSMYYNTAKGTEIYMSELYNASGTLLDTQTKSTQVNRNGWYISSLRASVSIYYSF